MDCSQGLSELHFGTVCLELLLTLALIVRGCAAAIAGRQKGTWSWFYPRPAVTVEQHQPHVRSFSIGSWAQSLLFIMLPRLKKE